MKKYLLRIVLVLTIMLLYANLVFAVTFRDVSSEHWAYSNIVNLVSRGVINGYEDGTYRPENPVTRGEFFKLLVMAMEDSGFEKNYLIYAPIYAHWAGVYENFLAIKGCLISDAESISLDDYITREEMAITIGKVALKEKYDGLIVYDVNDTKNKMPELIDLDNVSEGNRWLVKNTISKGYITGYEDFTFRSEKNMTRAEVATVITRILNGKKLELSEE